MKSKTRRAKVIAAVIPALFAAACEVAPQKIQSPSMPEAVACAAKFDPVPLVLKAGDLQLGQGLERAAHPVKVRNGCEAAMWDPDAPHGYSAADLAKLSDEDLSWRAADGSRYDAMLVLPDGTAYGRKGPAATALQNPDESNGFGAFEGALPSEAAIQAGIDRLEAAQRAGASVSNDPSNPFADEGNLAKGILGDSLADDRRSRITSTTSLTTFPLFVIGALNQTTQAGFTGCTASKVGPRHAITAAHCVLDASGNWTGSGWFHPGQTNTTHLNTGGTAVAWGGVYARDWRNAGRFDYAIIYLADRADSYNLGWMGVAWFASSEYSGKAAYIHGYPAKTGTSDVRRCKASALANKNCDGWMYGDFDVLDSSAYRSDGTLEYDIDTGPAQSGSAVRNGNNVIAVHFGCAAFGGCGPSNPFSSANRNHGARVRQDMWNDVCQWIGEVDSQFGSHPLCP